MPQLEEDGELFVHLVGDSDEEEEAGELGEDVDEEEERRGGAQGENGESREYDLKPVQSLHSPDPASEEESKPATADGTSDPDALEGAPPPKRRRVWEDGPHVQVTYRNLSRGSLSRLQEFLRCWSKAEEKACGSDASAGTETLSGSSVFFPGASGSPPLDAFGRAATGASMSSCWAEVPLTQPHAGKATPGATSAKAVCKKLASSAEVPSYDRAAGAALGITARGSRGGGVMKDMAGGVGTPSNNKSADLANSSRCFNCGSYVHSLRDCPKPKDAAAIAVARAEHSVKRGAPEGSNSADMMSNRYHGLTREEKKQQRYEGLEPGVLCPELREALGIRDLDPPPWLERMRQMGYPPGYLGYKQEVDSDSEDDVLPFITDSSSGGGQEDSKECAHQSDPSDQDFKTPAPPPASKKPRRWDIMCASPFAPPLPANTPPSLPRPPSAPPPSSERGGALPRSSSRDLSRENSESGREDGEIDTPRGLSQGEQGEVEEPVETVKFPGINAPLPVGASARRWGAESGSSYRVLHSRSHSDSGIGGYRSWDSGVYRGSPSLLGAYSHPIGAYQGWGYQMPSHGHTATGGVSHAAYQHERRAVDYGDMDLTD